MTQMDTDSSRQDARDPETFAIIGAAMAVHTELGCGFLERVYHEALHLELSSKGIDHACEVELPKKYRGNTLETTYRADFICMSNIIIELKAVSELTDAHLNQVINYLKATGLQRGLLINFGARRLEYRRIVY